MWMSFSFNPESAAWLRPPCGITVDLPRLLAVCDTFLGWPRVDQNRFVLGRRTGQLGQVADLDEPGVRDQIDTVAALIGVDLTQPIDSWIQEIRRQMV